MEKIALSKYVAAKRKQVGLSQKDLAELLFYTPQAMSRFESVDSAFPINQADALCQALDCSLDEVFLRQMDDTHYAPLPFDLDEVGALLSEARKQKGLTQEQMAYACNLTTRSLRNYESSKSHVSLQTLEAFCEVLNILPSGLKVVPVEAEAAPVAPAPRKRVWIPIVSALSAASIIAGIAITFALLPKNVPGPTASSDPLAASLAPAPGPIEITSQAMQESVDTIGKYGLDIVPGKPNFLKVSYEKNEFSSIGDSILITLSDAYEETYIDLLSYSDIMAFPVDSGGELSFDMQVVDANQLSLTLLSARNGEGSAINLFLEEDWFYSLGFFYYREETPVYIPSDVDHLFPINGGKVHCDLKSEVNVVLGDTQWLSFQINLFYNEMYVPFDEGIEPGYMLGTACLSTCRFASHNWSFGLADRAIKIPEMVEIDNQLVVAWVKVVGETEDYWYALDPLLIRIIK